MGATVAELEPAQARGIGHLPDTQPGIAARTVILVSLTRDARSAQRGSGQRPSHNLPGVYRMRLVLAVLCVSVLAACGGAVDSLDSDSEDIQGGSKDSGDPAVGLLWLGSGGFCTGTLI